MQSRAVLVPVKAFEAAKGRLAAELEMSERVGLARHLAEGVVNACAGLDVVIVSEDPGVAEWAQAHGAEALHNPMPGLNAAVTHGTAELAARGVERVLVTHADLAWPAALPDLFDLDGTVLVPDRHLDGTNALVVDTDAGFTFSYGQGSFARHLSEADRLAAPVHVVRGVGLDLDVDEPDDLALYRQPATQAPATQRRIS